MRLTLYGIALLLVGAPLTGCIEGDEPLDTGVAEALATEGAGEPLTGDNGTAAAAIDVEAPEWSVGDAWGVQNYGFGDFACTLVVTSASSGYTLSPTCEELAQADAVFDVSYVGAIRGSDLAGAQQGQPVQFFAFPLSDGKTWTTTWDGLPITLTATFAPALAAPGAGVGPGYTIVGATAEGEEYVRYDYSPLLKWWTHIDFAQGYGLKVQRFQENWTGAFKAAVSKEVYAHAPPTPGVFVPGAFSVSEGQTSLFVMFAGGAGMGYGYSLRLVDPAGNVAWEAQDFGEATSTFVATTIPAPAPGEWKALNAGSWNPQAGGFVLTVHEVLVSDVTLA